MSARGHSYKQDAMTALALAFAALLLTLALLHLAPRIGLGQPEGSLLKPLCPPLKICSQTNLGIQLPHQE